MADPTVKALETVAKHFQQLAQLQNPVPFEVKFTGNHADTLYWVKAVTNYMDINLLEDNKMSFRCIFPSLPAGVRSLYMTEVRAVVAGDGEDVEVKKAERFTVKYLKTWIIKKYPPMQSRVDFIKHLKRIRMRKDEDPIIVWNKLKSELAEVSSYIDTINESLHDDKKMAALTNHNKWEICCSIFINNNNQSRLGNDGIINQETVRRIFKANPQKYDDFTNIFANIHDHVMPKCSYAIREFKSYPYESSKSYHTNPKPKPKPQRPHGQRDRKPYSPQAGRKRKEYQDRDRYGHEYQQPWKKFKCYRCGNRGHKKSVCYNQYTTDGKYIGPNPKSAQKPCAKCGRTNHPTVKCVALKHKDGHYINNPQGTHGRPKGFKKYDQRDQKPKPKPQAQVRQQNFAKEVLLLDQIIKSDNSVSPEISNQFKKVLETLKESTTSPRSAQ